MKCDACGTNVMGYIKSYNHIYYFKGKKIEFKADRRFCEKCNNLIYDSVLDNAALMKGIEIYNSKYGIRKEEIIKFREKYSLSQELFSKIIGCAKKTLISYEQGKSIPNDNYLIILRALFLEPAIMLTLIEANKEHFSSKEIEKVKTNVHINESNNITQILFGNTGELNEFNGYTTLSFNKIENLILALSENGILKTKLYKEMFYSDFLCYKETGASITGLEYAKIKLGPVPDGHEKIIELLKLKNSIDYYIDFKNDYEHHIIKSKINFNKKVFTSEELEIITRVKKYFEKFSSKEIVEFSHKEDAFNKTEYFKNIDYDFAFNMSEL